jgi:hypothetical protein
MPPGAIPSSEHEDRHGETLAIRSHDVIRQWAAERDARPATVEGTERHGEPGVLRFDLGGYDGSRLKHVDWDEWFAPFDERDLVFVFLEHRADGSQSNFSISTTRVASTPELRDMHARSVRSTSDA